MDVTFCDYTDYTDTNLLDIDMGNEFDCHPRATRTLFVGNLNQGVTQDDLMVKFSVFGKIKVFCLFD